MAILDLIAPRRLVLQLTSRCTFACTHCYVSAVATGATLTSRQIDRAMELYASAQPAAAAVAFYGRGEASVAFAELRYAVRRAKELLRRPSFRIMSHGALNEQQRSYLLDNEFFVIVSFDGPRQTLRVVGGSAEVANRLAIETLRWYAQHGAASRLMAAVTFTHETYKQRFELAAVLTEAGVDTVSFYPMVPEGRAAGIVDVVMRQEEYNATREALLEAGLNIYAGAAPSPADARQAVPYGGGNYAFADLIVSPLGYLTLNRNVEEPAAGSDFIYGQIENERVILDQTAIHALKRRLEEQARHCAAARCPAVAGCGGIIKAVPITRATETLCQHARSAYATAAG